MGAGHRARHAALPFQRGLRRGQGTAFGARAAEAVEERILEVGPENVAAFVGEPVQGAGGVIIPPASYWPRVEAICRKYGILLVCDEVICGFGRLGRWFGFQHFGVKPDMVTHGQGPVVRLPADLGGGGGRPHRRDPAREVGGDFVHGYTYSGHPTCAAVALKNLEIMEREDLVGRTATATPAPYLPRRAGGLADHPLVGETRSLGLHRGGGDRRQEGNQPALRRRARQGRARCVRDLCIEQRPDDPGHARHPGDEPAADHQPRDQIDQMVGTIRKSLDQALPVLRERYPEAVVEAA